MHSDPENRTAVTHANGWRTLLALGILVAGFIASLYALTGFPLRVRAATDAAAAYALPQIVRPAQTSTPQANPAPAPETAANAMLEAVQTELDATREELRQSRQNLSQVIETQKKIRTASAVFLAVFTLIAVVIVVQAYLQARGWDKRSLRSLRQVEGIVAGLAPLQEAHAEIRRALPEMLQEVGEQPLSFQEDGTRFHPQALAILDDIEHLAYIGDARLSFREFSSQTEAAVYLNGLLLSAVSHLARPEPWKAFARLDRFFDLLARYPEAVERRRIAQAYSYRALAAYQVLDTQDSEPSWLRKTDRSSTDSLSRQAFEDLAHAAGLDPEWKHTAFVEALLCSRFYLPDEAVDTGSRKELFVRGLRRAVTLYKALIEEKAYRGPARRNLARSLKRIAELTGEKSDFSEFGYMLSSFPSDEELADEALAARQPGSHDRFLWQSMLGDEELFGVVERLNLAEYRAFWIRMLDNKVHLRNWRADLSEWHHRNPAMKEWSVQLLYAEPSISLANPISRRQERFDAPASGN